MFFNRISMATIAFMFVCYMQLAHALMVVSPHADQSWNVNSPLRVEWTAVNTDPEIVAIQISNMNARTYPAGFSKFLEKHILVSRHWIDVHKIDGLKAGPGYQINLLAENGGILAQSKPFEII